MFRVMQPLSSIPGFVITQGFAIAFGHMADSQSRVVFPDPPDLQICRNVKARAGVYKVYGLRL